MGKKKRRKNSKGNPFAALASFLGGAVRFLLKVCPLFILIFISGTLLIKVRGLLYADPNLAIQKITVDPSESLSVAQHEHLEQSLLGKNILQTDIKKVSRDLKKDPNIQEVRVVKHLPSELGVSVIRRKPAAFIRFSPKGNFGVISEDGVILDVVSEHDASGFYMEAFGLGVDEPHLGDRLRAPGFAEALEFKKAFEQQPMAHFEAITKMTLDHLGNVKMVLGQGPEVRLGRRLLERMDQIEKIIPLLEGEARKKIDYVDLQFDNVIVKQKRGIK